VIFRAVLCLLCLLASCAEMARAQAVRGELRLEVKDLQGAALQASGELVSEANQIQFSFAVGREGRYTARNLPFGVYRLSLSAPGFAAWSKLVRIESEVPLRISVTMGVEPLKTEVEVSDPATLVDPERAGTLYTMGQEAIREQRFAAPGREVPGLVDELPGWLLEANGVLHPRGSEYDVQYLVDGVPITENRSLAFAPAFDGEAVDSMRVLTASYPQNTGASWGESSKSARRRMFLRGCTPSWRAAVEASTRGMRRRGSRTRRGRMLFRSGGTDFTRSDISIRQCWRISPIALMALELLPPTSATFRSAIAFAFPGAAVRRGSWFPTNWCNSRRDSGRVCATAKPARKCIFSTRFRRTCC
jgi:hypothetical protein